MPRKRDTSQDPIHKSDIQRQVIREVISYFMVKYKDRYSVTPRIKKTSSFEEKLAQQFSDIAKELHGEHHERWRDLPTMSAKDEHKVIKQERVQIGSDWIDWLFTNRFGDPCLGDLLSAHWVTEYLRFATATKKPTYSDWTDTAAVMDTRVADSWD